MGNTNQTIVSRAGMRKDAERFSRLHSWNKHMRSDPYGAVFYLNLVNGEQPRNGIDHQVTDTEGVHLWFHRADMEDPEFLRALPFVSIRRPVILTKDFEGFPETKHPLEVERQKMIATIVQAGNAIATELGFEVVD
jgi:hypothetical protein